MTKASKRKPTNKELFDELQKSMSSVFGGGMKLTHAEKKKPRTKRGK